VSGGGEGPKAGWEGWLPWLGAKSGTIVLEPMLLHVMVLACFASLAAPFGEARGRGLVPDAHFSCPAVGYKNI
jgi:hypothetical protein